MMEAARFHGIQQLGGDARGTSPYCTGQGWEGKHRLMKAYIEGIEAMKEVDPKVRILTTEPLANITHSKGGRGLLAQCQPLRQHAPGTAHPDDQISQTYAARVSRGC